MATNPYSDAEHRASGVLAKKYPMETEILVWAVRLALHRELTIPYNQALTQVQLNSTRRRGLRELRRGHEEEYQRLFRAQKARMGL